MYTLHLFCYLALSLQYSVFPERLVRMGELNIENASSALALRVSPLKPESAVTTGPDTKPKKKICCACPDTKKLRDECVVEHGEDACAKWIDAHRQCLRAEGFNV